MEQMWRVDVAEEDVRDRVRLLWRLLKGGAKRTRRYAKSRRLRSPDMCCIAAVKSL